MVLLVYDWDWLRARAEIDRALELAPGDAEMVSFKAILEAAVGQTEKAVALGRQAVELDPMNPFAAYALIRSLFNLRDYAEVAKEVEYFTSLNHSAFRLRLFQGAGYLFMGQLAEAAAAIEKITTEWALLTGLACLRFAEGRLAESDSLLDDFKAERSKSSAFQIAEVYAFRNQAEECFEWLEISFRQRDPGTALIKCDPFFTSMYDDPRWQPFLRKMNLADDQLAFLSK
jgi:tetratricopeptide (TPR) repeat protein